MNRFELFFALVLLLALTVYTLRTKWFDRFISWTLQEKPDKMSAEKSSTEEKSSNKNE